MWHSLSGSIYDHHFETAFVDFSQDTNRTQIKRNVASRRQHRIIVRPGGCLCAEHNKYENTPIIACRFLPSSTSA